MDLNGGENHKKSLFGGEMVIEFEGKKYYTQKEVAQIFKVSPTTIRKWTRKGIIKASKIPGIKNVFYADEEIKKILERR